MEKYLRKIEAFHNKNGFSVNKSLKVMDEQPELENLHDVLMTLAQALEAKLEESNDVRFLRSMFMIEKLGNTVNAMMHSNEVALLDGLSDLLYVTLGTAKVFGMPIEAALDEVCDSNLSKARHTNDNIKFRHNRGADYQPPRLKQILMRHQGIVVHAQRIDCHTQEITIVDLMIKEEYNEALDDNFISIVDGGVTGFECMPSSAVKECIKIGWSACAGTKRQWDTLFVPPESMQLIADWLDESSLK